jgi:AraC-like DNA-binding protein
MDYILKTKITGPVLSQKLSDIYNFYQNEKQITSHILSQELTQFFQNPDLILDAPSFPGLYDKKDQLWHFGIITWNQNFVRDFNRMLDTVSVNTHNLSGQIQQYAQSNWIAPLYFFHGCYVFYAFPLNGTKKQDKHGFVSFGTSLHRWLTSRTGKSYMHFYTSQGMTLSAFHMFFHQHKDLFHYYSVFCPEHALELKFFNKQHVISSEHAFSYQKLIFESEQMENNMFLIKQYVMQCCENRDMNSIFQFYNGFCTLLETVTNGQLSAKDDLYAPAPEFLLKWIFNQCEQCCQILKYGSARQYGAAVNDAITFIQRNYSDDELTAEAISNSVGLSQSRLSVLFKQDTGKTLKEYLTDFRIQKAITLLENTNMKIYEIAEKCGYHSSQYFSQIIFQNTGKRPLDFRRAKKQEDSL